MDSQGIWEQFDGRLRSPSGVRLVGNLLVRFIYLDEAGISADDKVVVVAGVIVNGDRQFRDIEKRIGQLINEYVPFDKQAGFAFHAKELANGGKTFPRSETKLRLEALNKLAAVPAEFLLPVVYGYTTPADTPGSLNVEKRAILAQAVAYSLCAVAAETYMRQFAGKSEIAICVAEDNSSARRAVKGAHLMLKRPGQPPPGSPPSVVLEDMPLTRIVDTVHFAAKDEAAILQLADVCAYTIKRCLVGARYAGELYSRITGGQSFPGIDLANYPAGHQLVVPYIDSKYAHGASWLASRAVQSSNQVIQAGGYIIVPRSARRGENP